MILLLTLSKITILSILAIFGLIAAIGFQSDEPDFEGRCIQLGGIVLMFVCGYAAFTAPNRQPSKALERKNPPITATRSEATKLEDIEKRLKQKFKTGEVTGELFGAGTKGIHVQKTNQYYQVLPEIQVRRSSEKTIEATFSYEVRQHGNNAKALSGGTPQVWSKEFIDYPTGSYLLHESSLTMELMGGVRYAINQELRPFLDASGAIRIRLTGWADAQPISTSKPIVFKGEYAPFNGNYYLGEQLTPIPLQLSSGGTIPTNEILAVTRTLGARHFLENETDLIHLRGTKSYEHCAVADPNNAGGAYRKVQIRLELENKANPTDNPSMPQPPVDPPATQENCWACKIVAVWRTENVGILSILLGLTVFCYKKAFKDAKYANHRNALGALFLLLSALTAYCFH